VRPPTDRLGTNRYTASNSSRKRSISKTPTVYDYVEQETRLQRAVPPRPPGKTGTHKERFANGSVDDDRRERLCRLYNDTFHHSRVRTFNGEHLLAGASAGRPTSHFTRSQACGAFANAQHAARHVVGAGRLTTMVAAAMELKRLGLARKPMFAVPNTCSASFRPSCSCCIRAANILVRARKILSRRNAKRNYSAASPPAIGCRHRHTLRFERIHCHAETRNVFSKEQLEELEKINGTCQRTINRAW